MHATLPLLLQSDFPAIRRGRLETLQVNLGYRCNQSCLHCHVNAGPARKEMMSADTADEVIRYLADSDIRTLDLTGGAPELNPGFRRLVRAARGKGIRVIDRCNLTVLLEPGQEGTAGFLADNEVEIVASLPCYIKENVDNQRGEGVYEHSLEALRLLNRLGYGRYDSGLILNLAGFFQQYFYLLFGLLQGLLAGTRELNAALEMLQRLLQAQVALLHFRNQGFQLFQGFLKRCCVLLFSGHCLKLLSIRPTLPQLGEGGQ
jgi:hypothetical protein